MSGFFAWTNAQNITPTARLIDEINAQEAQTNALRWRFPIQNNFATLHHIEPNGTPIYYSTRSNWAAAKSIGIEALQNNVNQFFGKNLTIGVWDIGTVRTTHQELSPRIALRDNAVFPSNISSNDHHATHTIATMVAQGKNAQVKGLASAASVDYYNTENDLQELLQAAQNGLLVSCHAYGPAFPSTTEAWRLGYYDAEARRWDLLTEAAPYCLPINACGNDGDGTQYDRLIGLSTAKNPLMVGACAINNQSFLAPFTSFGPTDDGRIKPDLVAPGIDIFSARSNADDAYFSLSGTSMASAVVAGGAILLQEMYFAQNQKYMRAATLKALLIHTANEVGNTQGPDYQAGWGAINLEKATQMLCNEQIDQTFIETSLSNKTEFSYTFNTSTASQLKITLSWTDPAADVLPPSNASRNDRNARLVNDLDLRLYDAQGKLLDLPWVLDPENPQKGAQKADNTVDVIEQIVQENIQPFAQYTLKVSHKKKLIGTTQPFSLLISNVQKEWVKANDNALFSTIKATQYQWLQKDNTLIEGAQSATYVPEKAGYYRLKIRNACGEEKISTWVAWQSNQQANFWEGIQLTPNPITTFLEIALPKKTAVEVVVMDLQGKVWYSGTHVFPHFLRLKLPTYIPQGIYIVRLSSQDTKEVWQQKIIKY